MSSSSHREALRDTQLRRLSTLTWRTAQVGLAATFILTTAISRTAHSADTANGSGAPTGTAQPGAASGDDGASPGAPAPSGSGTGTTAKGSKSAAQVGGSAAKGTTGSVRTATTAPKGTTAPAPQPTTTAPVRQPTTKPTTTAAPPVTSTHTSKP